MTNGTIADGVARVRERVEAAATRVARDASEVRIVAATKYVDDVEQIVEAMAAGITDLGENTAQALAAKAAALGLGPRWHFLGSIQTNKVRLLDPVTLIQSLHREREADALNRRGEAASRSYDVLIEVNLAREPAKQGIAPEGLEGLLDGLRAFPRVRPCGLMFVAPQVENPEDVRWMFAEARILRDGLRERFAGYDLRELSMGMTEDFEVAVEEGATIVRIGRAIFRPDPMERE